MLLHLHQTVPNEVSCYTILPNGSDRCRVVCVAHEYASSENRVRFDGVVVCIMILCHPNHENRMA
jgi:hypothetical protein